MKPAICGRPRCRTEFQQSARGRRRVYCSEACLRTADREQRRLRTLIAHYGRMIKMCETDLAAFGAMPVR